MKGAKIVDGSHVLILAHLSKAQGAGEVNVFGFKDEDITKLICKSHLHPTAVISQGPTTIVVSQQSGGARVSLLEDDGQVKHVKCHFENLTIVAATETDIYGLKDAGLHRGQLVNVGEQPTLSLQVTCPSLQVASVACGFDHTLMLTNTGALYTCGSDSRGQLGHGDTSVDLVHTPTIVEALQGTRIVTIATGGWHSAAVTECGDVYVWGWNEAGQLGLPNGSTDKYCAASCQDSLPAGRTQQPSDSHCSVGRQDSRPAGRTQQPSASHCGAGRQDSQPAGRTQQPSDSHCDAAEGTMEEAHPGQPLRLLQDVDPVLIQTLPYGLDIPDDVRVKKVACGSRHTCVLLDSGCVLTAGWNKYGQLGLGHSHSIDFLQTVRLPRGLHVLDVQAGSWNTAIITTSHSQPPHTIPP